MGILFNKMKEPVFLKESSNAETQLEELRGIEPLLNEEGKKILQQDITCLEYGIAGEKNIAFELKNSHMPMYVLHDIYLESGDLSAQIDYLVITRKICFVVECKNLYGNITIDKNGNFIRTMYFGTHKVQEGLYSPITQNIRHLELIKKIKSDNSTNKVKKFLFLSYFDNSHKSIVVLANPKTILNDRYAIKEIRNQVIRADQLVKYIKNTYESSKEEPLNDEELLHWANTFIGISKDNPKTYLEKYEKYKVQDPIEENKDDVIEKETVQKETSIKVETEAQENGTVCPRCGSPLIKRKGKYGEFLGCSSFPKCRYTKKL